MPHLFPGNPLEHLDPYRKFTESSFLVDVQRWADAADPELRELGGRWQQILCRKVSWKMAVERTVNFHTPAGERTTIFSEPDLMLRRVRERLPDAICNIPLKIDVARHYHRPSGRLPVGGQNFLLDPALGEPQELSDDELFRALPVSFIIFRIYSRDHQHDAHLVTALNAVLGEAGDAKSNM
jgi:hypothetical protein